MEGRVEGRRTRRTRAAGRSPLSAGELPRLRRPRCRRPRLRRFGQPTIAGIAGWGFEADLRLDPTNANRVYISSPDSGGSDTSWIWRSLDGGRTFKWVPAAAPLGGKVIPCPGGGDTELAVDTAGHLYFNDLSLANFSLARSDDFGKTFTRATPASCRARVDRQWYAIDGDPTAGGSVYLTNDEVGDGQRSVRNDDREQRAGHVPLTGRRLPPERRRARLRAAEPDHAAGLLRRGDHGQRRGQPRRDEDRRTVNEGRRGSRGGPAMSRHPRRRQPQQDPDRARCFPVAFGAPVANVSDPSGLNCVDLPVANLGDPDTVRTGGNFPSLAIDRAGNLYAMWEQAQLIGGKAGDTTLMYAYSTNEGKHLVDAHPGPDAGPRQQRLRLDRRRRRRARRHRVVRHRSARRSDDRRAERLP